MTLAPGWATIPSRIRRDLNIRHDQSLSILEIKSLEAHPKMHFHIENGKVDMLSLIPEQTDKGYRLYVDQHEKDGESWLSIWCYHTRGSARQIGLKRYANTSTLGSLFGQLQAEGEKNGSRVAFKNTSISEHADFVSALLHLGIPLQSIRGRCVFNPTKASANAVLGYIESYKKATGITKCSSDPARTMKGSVAAESYVRSIILARILLFAMDEVRSGSLQNDSLRQNFLAKLLSGDGSLGPRKTAKRLDVRLTIVDQNLRYLKDYAEILSQEGFKAKVITKRLTVRAYCTWQNLLKLYKIGAFKNGKNWIKLLCSIAIAIKGTQNRGYRRIQELSNQARITSLDLCTKYGIGRRAANLWISRMRQVGFMEVLPKVPDNYYKNYAITGEGKEISKLLDAVERDYCQLTSEKNRDPVSILEEIKEKKSRLTSTEQRSESR